MFLDFETDRATLGMHEILYGAIGSNAAYVIRRTEHPEVRIVHVYGSGKFEADRAVGEWRIGAQFVRPGVGAGHPELDRAPLKETVSAILLGVLPSTENNRVELVIRMARDLPRETSRPWILLLLFSTLGGNLQIPPLLAPSSKPPSSRC